MTAQDSPSLKDGFAPEQSSYLPNLKGRYKIDGIFSVVALVCTWIGLIVLAWLLLDVLIDGVPVLNWNFLTAFPSRRPEDAGLLSALVGSIWLMGIVIVFAIPVGIGAGIFLEEFIKDSWF